MERRISHRGKRLKRSFCGLKKKTDSAYICGKRICKKWSHIQLKTAAKKDLHMGLKFARIVRIFSALHATPEILHYADFSHMRDSFKMILV